MTRPTLICCALACMGAITFSNSAASARNVVAFWEFASDYDFVTNPNKQDFDADVDATLAGDAHLQAYLGVADNLDNNGGGGFATYTSPTSGIAYGLSRTLKFDDLKGGGDDFDIAGTSTFRVDKNDGAGPMPDNFSNDALMYITLDGTGYQDFQIRFDAEAEPEDHPTSFDIFFRTGATGGVWYRLSDQNNIPLNFVDYLPADPENMYADSGVILLSPILNGASIELIINDFAEGPGNGELEFDNIEITANRTIPEPSSLLLLTLSMLASIGRRRGTR